MTTLNPDPSDVEYELLLEVAYFALDERMLEEAGAILEALAGARRDKPYPRIGLALRAYAMGDAGAAIDALYAVLADFPDAVFTRAMLARFLKDVGRDGWERCACEVLARVDAGVAAEIARGLLDPDASPRATAVTPREGGAAAADPEPRVVRRV